MSDQPEALSLADELGLAAGDYAEWHKHLGYNSAAELRRQHSEIEALKAERDALKAEVERLKGVCYDLTGQLMVLNATKQMQAAIDAAREVHS